ncbi:MAG: hypothetical protein ACE5H4_10515 [Candidatus Thorarchaeota archaeon]
MMFTCKKCREPFYVEEAEIRGNNLRVYVQCLNGHKGKREISRFQADNSAFELFEGLFTCVECGSKMGIASTDAHRNRMEYIFVCPIHGARPRHIPGLYHPTVTELQTEVNTAKSVLDSLSCPRCGEVFVVHEIEERAGIVAAKAKCPNGHKEMRFIPRQTDESILKTVLKRLIHCDTCGLPASIENVSTKGNKTKVQISCPVHGSAKKELPAQFSHLLDSVAQAVTEGTLLRSVLKCKDCGNPLSVRSIEESRDDYKLKIGCSNGHNYEMIQHIEWSDEATDEIARAVLKCNECDLLTKIVEQKVDGTRAEIEVVCPIHQTMKKGLTVEVFKHLEVRDPEIDRQPSIEESLKCLKCGTPVTVRDSGFGKGMIEAKVECQKNHGDTRYYVEDFGPEILEQVYDKMFECHKCHRPMDLVSFQEVKDKGQVNLVCEKHGERRLEVPATHGLMVRDAYTARMSLPKIQTLTKTTLTKEDASTFQFDPGLDSDEMFQTARSVIEQHDVQFVSDDQTNGVKQAWYYGKALKGDEFVVVGSVSGDKHEIEIQGFSDNEEHLGSLMAHMRENLREVLLRIREDADDIQPLIVQCVHCNAALSKRGLPGETTRCEHCGVPLHW